MVLPSPAVKLCVIALLGAFEETRGGWEGLETRRGAALVVVPPVAWRGGGAGARATTWTLCVMGFAVVRFRVATAVLVNDRLLRALAGDATPDIGWSLESFLPE